MAAFPKLVIPTDGDDIVIDGYMKLGDIKGEIVGGDGHNDVKAAENFAGAYDRTIAGFETDALTSAGASTFTPVANRNGTATLQAEDDSLGDISRGIVFDPLNRTELRSDNRFVIEPMEAMTSFGESFDPAPETGGFQPREVAAVEIGQPPDPKLWLQMLS